MAKAKSRARRAFNKAHTKAGVAKSNKFDTQANKKAKFSVLGREVKGAKRNVAAARQKINERRVLTLRSEVEQTGKDNLWINNRMGDEDKRRIQEASMAARRTFQLSDSEDEELTIGGRPFTEAMKQSKRDFMDNVDDSSDDEDNTMDHFGGGFEKVEAPEGESLAKWSELNGVEKIKLRNEIRAEKQKEKSEELKMTEEVDADFEDLLHGGLLQHKLTKKEREKQRFEALKRGESVAPKKRELDDFDKIFNQISRDGGQRAYGTDREKTAEEVAKEQEKELLKHEKERLARAKGHEIVNKEDIKNEKKRLASAEDLSGNLDYDTNMMMSDDDSEDSQAELVEMGAFYSESENDGDDEDSSDLDGDAGGFGNYETISDSEESDFDDEYDDEEDMEDGRMKHDEFAVDEDDNKDISLSEVRKEKQRRRELREAAEKELPFMLNCPGNYEEFAILLEEYGTDSITLDKICDRLMKGHSIHLAAENRNKMQTLLGVLLRHFNDILKTSEGNSEEDAEYINVLSKYIYDLVKISPQVGVHLFKQYLNHIFENVTKALGKDRRRTFRWNERVLAGQNPQPLGSCSAWPKAYEIAFLQLASKIFPCSDMRHPVVTPMYLLIGQCLSHCSVRTPKDILAGMALANIMLDMSYESGRLVPEAISFLSATMTALVPLVPKAKRPSTPLPTFDLFTRKRYNNLKSHLNDEETTPAMSLSALNSENDQITESSVTKGIICACYHLLHRTTIRLKDSPSFTEIFGSFLSLLAKVKLKNYCKKIKTNHKTCMGRLCNLIQEQLSTRKPLVFKDYGVKPIKTLDCDVDLAFNPLHKHPDRDVDERRKLNKKINRARRAAARDIRQDADFVSKIREEKKQERNAEREDKTRELMAFLNEQQRTFNQMVKEGNVHGAGKSQANAQRR
eukprot:TRINITY_DN5419_c0_g1_i1.p1 TRINITY_DN5419_c0_g1~~TRINITY_DN5419_c0_g1_i1.p1  ORF type:complete len:911 (-),score=356.63 TRINITY_DN5419_c0_g1_i1:165-2897(-)